MSGASPNPTEVKLLPNEAQASASTVVATTAVSSPSRQLSDLPKDELEHLAEEFGVDATRHATRQELVAALHERRQLIAGMDREAMMEVVRWGRRPVTANAAKEQLAQEIARIRLMDFRGLSQRGLLTLARLRAIQVNDEDDVPALVKKLKKQEGFVSRLNRKRRAMLGSLVSKIVGDDETVAGDYRYLPPAAGASPVPPPSSKAGLREDIEESGLFGGITNRIKKTADSYLNQKLDEIEARIDRKLDEIDRRLAEWRDKEIANRIRILKITLWASVIVAALSLVYSYIQVYFYPDTHSPPARVEPPAKPKT